jgi:hypothetical protein
MQMFVAGVLHVPFKGGALGPIEGCIAGLFLAAVVTLPCLAYGVTFGQETRRKSRTACLARRLCPSCGYCMNAAVLSAERRRVCPECTAEWYFFEDAGFDPMDRYP